MLAEQQWNYEAKHTNYENSSMKYNHVIAKHKWNYEAKHAN
jgi:hypothetical protein